MNSLFTAIRKNSIGLAIFAAVTAGLIAFVQASTQDKISHNIQQARVKALHQILPSEAHDNDLLRDAFWIDSKALGLTKAEEGFIARKDGQPIAVFLPLQATEGYTGPIRLVVGIKVNGDLAGVRVLQHQETPGLGDQIELKKSNWILSFNGRSLTNPQETDWNVKKDGGQFDQFTGATITPRAIVKAVHSALTLFKQHQASILAADVHDTTKKPTPNRVLALEIKEAGVNR
jgi:electron transport complex protein RnfG